MRTIEQGLLWAPTLLFAFVTAHGQVTAISAIPNADNDSDRSPAVVTVGSGNSTFPDRKQQLHNYLSSAFGPSAFLRSAIGAGIDQGKPAPPEWDSGAEGYGERYGFRFGMSLVSETAKYSLGGLMHEDVAYHRCLCTGFLPRSTHALVATFSAKTRGRRTVLSFPSLVGPYAGSFTAVSAWYPSRYEATDAARLGTVSFAFQMGGNLAREFLPHRR